MRGSVAALLGVAVGVVVVAVALGAGAAVVLGLVVGSAGMIWRFGPCHHPGPLGLLPPVTAADGTRTTAQWYCDECGRSWAADFEREQHPVRRFEGHDESKAAAAARRAEELEKRRRTLAVRRAGLDTPVVRPRVHATGPTRVVAMPRVRGLAGK